MPKCKITYEYIQYDGLNGREVAEFVKNKILEKDMKFVWEEDKASDTCYAGVKSLRWKCYNPKMIKKESAFECGIFEGQYAIYDKSRNDIRIIPLSVFKSTYEEDAEIDASEILKKITDTPPYVPNPWYPEPTPIPQWNRDVWCKQNSGDPLPYVGTITSSTENKSK